MFKFSLYFNLFILMLLLTTRETLSLSHLNGLKILEKEGAKVSALFVSLSDGKVIASQNADQMVTPASISKLVIAGQSLDTWGPDKSFVTKIYSRGSLNENGTLKGHLVFYGGGDPYIVNEKLWFLTTDVQRYGIKKIEGNLIVNNSFFGPMIRDESRKSAKFSSANAYDSPLSSAAVNFSVLAVVVYPSQTQGKEANITIEPFEIASVKIINKVKTVSPKETTQIFVTRKTIEGKDVFTVTGKIPQGAMPERIYRSISDPEIYAGEVVMAFLRASGIEITGQVIVENVPPPTTDNLVSQIEGYPLEWQLRGLNNMSNNFIADM
ncbi:MAG: D-alanyl-D-alanine carboxypeptidase/D-alanyl-D-alanine-endopeptidase, partial [Silvanigrellaceae bacterium]|nr:D-alanyl-D-alanine carboxypeptidase/D-alanyl-D-alanine-endopeptidase [Silvanigrellaceae bacterium]